VEALVLTTGAGPKGDKAISGQEGEKRNDRPRAQREGWEWRWKEGEDESIGAGGPHPTTPPKQKATHANTHHNHPPNTHRITLLGPRSFGAY